MYDFPMYFCCEEFTIQTRTNMEKCSKEVLGKVLCWQDQSSNAQTYQSLSRLGDDVLSEYVVRNDVASVSNSVFFWIHFGWVRLDFFFKDHLETFGQFSRQQHVVFFSKLSKDRGWQHHHCKFGDRKVQWMVFFPVSPCRSDFPGCQGWFVSSLKLTF